MKEHTLELVDMQGYKRIVECTKCDRALILGPGPKVKILRNGEFYAKHGYGLKINAT